MTHENGNCVVDMQLGLVVLGAPPTTTSLYIHKAIASYVMCNRYGLCIQAAPKPSKTDDAHQLDYNKSRQFNKMKDLRKTIVFGHVFYVIRTSSRLTFAVCDTCARLTLSLHLASDTSHIV